MEGERDPFGQTVVSLGSAALIVGIVLIAIGQTIAAVERVVAIVWP